MSSDTNDTNDPQDAPAQNDLDDLLNRAHSWMSQPKDLGPDARDAVVRDSFDTGLANDIIDITPALGDLVDDLHNRYSNTRDLTADLLNWFWQRRPDVRELDDMADTHKVNGAVIQEMILSADALKLRDMTKGNNYAAAMATMAIEQQLRQLLNKHTDLASASDELAALRDQYRRASKDVEEKLVILLELTNDPNAPQVDVEKAAQALADALDAIVVIVDKRDQASKDLDQAVADANADMARAVDKATSETREKLEQEEALADAFGLGPADLQKLPFKERVALMERLRGTKLARFADLVGRFRRLSFAEQSRKTDFGRDHIHGTELSDDPTRVVAAEWGKANASPELKAQQIAKLTNGELLSRAYKGKEKVGKGAIIVCRDESSSMGAVDEHGIPRSAWATAMSLALLQQANQQGRDFACVSFSTSNKVWHFPKGEATLDQKIDFTEHFLGGGTNAMAAFDAAASVLEAEFNKDGRPKGDVVFITDDAMHASPDWIVRWRETKKRLDYRVFGILIGREVAPNSTLADLSDNVRSITEFADPADVADIFRAI